MTTVVERIAAEPNSLRALIEPLQSGTRPTGGASATKGVLSLGAEHIGSNGSISIENPRYVSTEFAASMTRGSVRAGDVLLVKDGATTGRVALVTSEFDGAVINEHVFIIRPKADVDGRYLFLALRSPSGQRMIRRSFQGSAQGGINQSFADEFILPTPEPGEQERVADYLLEQMDHSAQVLHASMTEYEAATALKYRLVAHALDGLGAPDGELGEVLLARPRSGWSPTEDPKGSTPVLTLSSVLHFEYDGSQIKYTSEDVDPEAHYWIREGDIYISRSNTAQLVGHAAICDGHPQGGIYSDLLMKLEIDRDRVDPKFAVIWLMSPVARTFVTREARGSSGTMKKINQDIIIKIPFPTQVAVADQERISATVWADLERARDMRRAAAELRDAARNLGRALLREAFQDIYFKELSYA